MVVLNGEIYNFLALRADCRSFPYRSRTDTEVILAAYEKYGEQFVDRLDGMFAFALWDQGEGKLLIARDRIGKKPLYYFHARFFAFASEIKSLMALKGISPALDEAALPLYLTYGYVPTPGSFVHGVKKLEPGTLMIVGVDGSLRSHAFWQYPLKGHGRTGRRTGAEDAAVRLRELMANAVSRRMIADVPIGAFLSGGIDSSIVTGVMSRISGEPVRTFSIGFEGDATFDETDYARKVADKFGTRHTEFRVMPRAVELLERLVWHYDEPFGDSSAIPTYIVSKLARDHVTVALSGDGGDELFAGYERFAAALWTEKLPRGVFAAGRVLSRWIPAPAHVKSRRRRVKRFFEKSTLPLRDRFLEWNSFFTRSEISELLGEGASRGVEGSYTSCLNAASGDSLLGKLLYLNFRTYLLDDLLVKTDRMSMAHGLEVRCPFLDTQLLEWAVGLEDEFKIRGRTLKYILRQAYRDMLPVDILARPKMGFGVPLGQWLRQDLKEFALDLLSGPSSKIRALMDLGLVQRLLTTHLRGEQDNGQQIWALLTLEVWLRRLSARDWSYPAGGNIW
jgi:asparagine synthase (glutamine-hydrolysing)